MYRFIRFIVFSDVWVGLAVAAFTYLSYSRSGSVNNIYIALAFFGTVAVYNYMRIAEKVEVNRGNFGSQAVWIRRHLPQAIFFTILSGTIAAVFFFLMFSWSLFFLMTIPFLIALLYPISFKYPFGSFTSLRTIPGLKLLLIAFSWSYVTCLVPLAVAYGEFCPGHLAEFGMRMFYIAALVIPFDMRDMMLDNQRLQTLPQRYGLDRSRKIALWGVLLYALWKIIQLAWSGDAVMILPWIAGLLFSAILIYNMKPGRSYIYCGFWVESSPIVIALFVWGFRYLFPG